MAVEVRNLIYVKWLDFNCFAFLERTAIDLQLDSIRLL